MIRTLINRCHKPYLGPTWLRSFSWTPVLRARKVFVGSSSLSNASRNAPNYQKLLAESDIPDAFEDFLSMPMVEEENLQYMDHEDADGEQRLLTSRLASFPDGSSGDTKQEMAKLPRNCSSCGYPLQIMDPGMLGYVNPVALEVKKSSKSSRHSTESEGPRLLSAQAIKRATREVICYRCHKIRSDGHLLRELETKKENEKGLAILKGRPGLLVHLVDAFDLKGSIIANLQQFLKVSAKNPVYLAISKIDLFAPYSSSPGLTKAFESRVSELAIHLAKQAGVRNVVGAGVYSALYDYNINLIRAKIEKHRDGANVYLVGSTSVGKSALVNAILKNYKKENIHLKKNGPLISYHPGVTLRCLKFPIHPPRPTDLPPAPDLVLGNAASQPRRNNHRRKIPEFFDSMGQLLVDTDASILQAKTPFANKVTDGLQYIYNSETAASEISSDTSGVNFNPNASSAYFMDTPGIIRDNHYHFVENEKTLKELTPKPNAKPVHISLEPGQALFSPYFGAIEYYRGINPIFITTFCASAAAPRIYPSVEAIPDTKIRYESTLCTAKFIGEGRRINNMDIFLPGYAYFTTSGSVANLHTLRIHTYAHIPAHYEESLNPDYYASLAGMKFQRSALASSGPKKSFHVM